MKVFQRSEKKLDCLSDVDFEKESELHAFVEENLETLFGLKIVRNQFSVGGIRIDTLAFDEKRDAFVIIEYKNELSHSVIEQTVDYMYVMENNKAEFTNEYNRVISKDNKREKYDFEWSKSSVLILAPDFTQRQVNFATWMRKQGAYFYLCKFCQYEKQVLTFEHRVRVDIKVDPFPLDCQIDTEFQSSDVGSRADTASQSDDSNRYERLEYPIYMHTDQLNEQGKEIWDQLHDSIIDTDPDAKFIARMYYIAWSIGDHSVCRFYLDKDESGIVIQIPKRIRKKTRPLQLDDPKDMAREYTEQSGGNKGSTSYFVDLYNNEDIGYVIGLLQQKCKLIEKANN